jgi:hypothetical protein
VVVVDNAAAARALFLILERTKYLAEPAAYCCLAAAEAQRDRFTAQDRVVLVLCGGNVSVQDLTDFYARFVAPAVPLASTAGAHGARSRGDVTEEGGHVVRMAGGARSGVACGRRDLRPRAGRTGRPVH